MSLSSHNIWAWLKLRSTVPVNSKEINHVTGRTSNVQITEWYLDDLPNLEKNLLCEGQVSLIELHVIIVERLVDNGVFIRRRMIATQRKMLLATIMEGKKEEENFYKMILV